MKAVVLAAGRSTRAYPLTLTRPKPLLPLLGEPLAAHTLRGLAPHVEEVVLVIAYRGEMVRAAFGDDFAGVRLRYVEQRAPRGTGDAVAAAQGAVAGDFLVVNGDDYYAPGDIGAVAAAAGAALLGVPVASAAPFGRLRMSDGVLVGIDEKPPQGGAGLANAGLYKIDEAIFGYLAATGPSSRGELEFTAALGAYAAAHRVAVVEAAGPWRPIATARDLLAAQLTLWPAGEDPILGGDCRLSPAATVGGRSALGAACEVAANATVEASLLLDGVRVGEGAAVAGSVLGAGVVVGAGAAVDGAVLGDGAVVGEGARVEPGSRVWPGVVVAPAAVVAGDVTAE